MKKQDIAKTIGSLKRTLDAFITDSYADEDIYNTDYFRRMTHIVSDRLGELEKEIYSKEKTKTEVIPSHPKREETK